MHVHAYTQIKDNINHLIDNPLVGKSFFFVFSRMNGRQFLEQRSLLFVCIISNPSFTIMLHRLRDFNCPFPLQHNGCQRTNFLTTNPGSTRIIVHDVQAEALRSQPQHPVHSDRQSCEKTLSFNNVVLQLSL